MSVRKRKWTSPHGVELSAWVCDFTDLEGVRRRKTFKLKKEADRFATMVRQKHLIAELHENGPASAATLPDRGSIPSQGNKNMTTNTTTTTENPDLPSLSDAVDILNRAWSQVELINMAAEACTVTGEAGNAIAWGCISVQELLKQVKEHLEPRIHALAKGSKIEAASNVGHVLSGMLDAYQAAIDKINQTDGDAKEDDVTRLQDTALSIISYRPFTKGDERRKAEFLREYTVGTLLDEEEQKALVASLMPEGAAS